ncbi:D-alanyl-D-alanine carboxypeptidase [Streptomyces hawaiiensis]|uniref:D-alanyl-D-alanine carboxypeptidase n=1 Tax=Streptomyces hawaiiensis TaxID=67305 RepID=UPI0036677965
MAGESPDRSKQRESSARRTSGSASPVPEARSEAADPRLAVARDPQRSSARGGADTATRVLSTRTAEEPENAGRAASGSDPDDDAERGDSDSGPEDGAGGAARAARDSDAEGAESDSDTEDAAAEAGQGASGSAGAGVGGSSGGDGGDGRLRDVVAAWVASADGDDEAAAAGDDAEGAEKPDEVDADAAQEAGKATGAAKTGTDADASDAEGDRADEPAKAGADTRDGQEAAEAAPEGSEAGQGDDEPEADRSAIAGTAEAKASEPAVDPRVSDDTKAAPKAAEAGPAEAKADEPADDEDPEPADPRAHNNARTAGTDTDAETAEAKAATPADGKSPEPADPRADTDAKAAGTDTDAETAEAKAGTPADDKSPEPADPRADNDAKAADTDTDAGTADAKSAKSAERADDAEAAPKTADVKTADADPEAGTADTAEDEPGGDSKPKPGGAAGVSDESDADDSPVDQPTAVFKAVRPPVDQPTTMLKLGGATKDVPERDAERTSKFVALKPLDDPAARKPAAPADATAPVPTVGPERTTQQPLPPRPPLDLLAELTNTPPPPETPLRTAARRVKIWTPLVLLLVVVFAVVQSVRPLPAPTLELTADDSYTFEGGKVDIPWPADGQAALDVQGIGTFGSSGEQKPVPIASVAKVMTAYVVLRDHPLKSGEDGPKIDIDQAAQDQSDAGQESTVDVTKGDKITEREALESILIASANNVARLLARWDAGSEKAFVRKMNQTATDLGMKNTTYTDPSGLNNTTVSTAVDQVKLAKAAMQQPVFREVATMMSYVDYKGKKHDNWNRLVGYNDVTGIKTGTTTSALGNLVFSARKDVNGEVRRIIGAVVRQPAGGPDNTILGAALHEGDKLIRAAQGALKSATILKKGDVVGYADDGLGGRTPVAVTEDVTAVGWAGLSVKLTFAGDDLPHTAKAGAKVGTLTVGDGTTSAVKVPVALQKDLVEPDFAAKLTRLG